ncbi:heparan-sulfate 6-O-sulfotransferase 2-like [Haliotis asinina]|uniref:heparan-sulfate 6-O-sulfotransferase 2-like n=1 Tax=Haliotis asinina TaxID=109174 RepID=UPI0035319303
MARTLSLTTGIITGVGFLWITWICFSLVFEVYEEVIPAQNVYGTNVETFYIDKMGHDVLVFVQIPYTGAEDLSTLLQNGLIYGKCRNCYGQRDCPCYVYSREQVLFSSIKHPWPCGYYPAVRALKACIGASRNQGVRRRPLRQMRYLFVTLLRYPAHQFYNEWDEVRNHGWQKWSRFPAAKVDNANRECSAMFKGKNLSFKTFTSCPQNPAFNRQTRMLANVTLDECLSTTGMSEVQCYDTMLISAKDTLKHMPFFGITEYSYMTQVLFEETFQLKVVDKYLHVKHLKTFMSLSNISSEDMETISNVNKYDFLLYDYAMGLFFERYDSLVTLKATEL